MLVVQEEKSGAYQSQQDSSCGNHECQYKFNPIQSIQSLLRFFSLGESGGLTNQQSLS